MSPREANVLLTHVTLLDGRFKRTPEEQAQMAIAWSGLLADVTLDAALAAVNEHYATETRGIMPADVVEFAEERAAERDLTVEREMQERDAWLLGRGIRPEDWDRALASGQSPREVLASFGVPIAEVTA